MTPRVAVCWDIDGTLLRAMRIGREVLLDAFAAVTGHRAPGDPEPGEAVAMAGRTDWLIGEALRDALPAEHRAAVLDRGDDFGHALIAAVVEQWGRRAAELAAVARVLPGVEETVAALGAEPSVVQTLTTGNVRAGAVAKLTAVGLLDAAGRGHIDPDLGGYGDGPGERVRVVRGARDALRARYGAAPALVVVGDTPLDVAAAHAGGAVAVGAATGGASAGELRDAGAEHVLDDLTDPAGLVAVVRDASEDDRRAARRGRVGGSGQP